VAEGRLDEELALAQETPGSSPRIRWRLYDLGLSTRIRRNATAPGVESFDAALAIEPGFAGALNQTRP